MTRVPPPREAITGYASPMIMETVVSDNQTAERLKVTLHRTAVGSATVLVPAKPAPEMPPETPATESKAAHAATDDAMSPDEALQVLSLAQRTAENHITAANRHAQTVRSEARTAADQIRADAHAYAEKVRAEADRLVADARSAVEFRGRDADAHAAEIRRQAASALADARAEAERIVAEGRDRAEQLDLRARQRYEDAVGSLEIKRETLHKQIEALALFDADYRQRLASFMNAQLRALWIDRHEAGEMPEVGPQLPGGPVDSPGDI
jgi:vacuolar-type H+-ATPase subunit H